MSDQDVTCPTCDVTFHVVWLNSYEAQLQGGPQHCPFCGRELDYAELAEESQ